MKKTLLIFAALLGFAVASAETTPPDGATVEYYNGTGYSYAFNDEMEWQAEVAIVGDQMYVRNFFAAVDYAKWVVGTIEGNTVTFAINQPFGGMDQRKYGASMNITDGVFVGFDDDMEETDAHFSWNPSTKTLVNTDYSVGADTEEFEGTYDIYDGTSDPEATLTLVGTGETYVYSPVTAISDVKVTETAKAVKTIENGQVVIEKNGVKYNVMGQKL
ncbi:MAG: hypothetical protein MJZ74_09565 [Muribaculaceae bacterium]|nr:hypothetical protein [Muribaculaceae bacterium]